MWRLSSRCPADWAEKLARAGGGFFHTPAGLGVCAPRGEPVFAELAVGAEVVGVAAGVRSRCRFTAQLRHVYLPTLPALAFDGGREAALVNLVALLRDQGAVEVVADAFDACWVPGGVPGAEDTRPRQEYVVPLDAEPDALARRFSRHHQRGLRHGQRERWDLRTHDAHEARDVLSVVQQAAARRAAQRRDAHMVEPLPGAAALGDGRDWGTTTFAAWRGGELLCAALVGWANGRAFFLRGGSTPEGYRSNAAVWLHWRIMGVLAARGITEYNLGGAPGQALRPEDPAHGLHRFKRDFGSEVRSCHGMRWTLSPAHIQAHRLVPPAPYRVVSASP
ncbi:MAG TPA: GNAT family N-acetyltransferase [Gemmatimonadales bacterium]|nr:GNAT family N-acetyltransferase [Gemmatimonadales bacterium]